MSAEATSSLERPVSGDSSSPDYSSPGKEAAEVYTRWLHHLDAEIQRHHSRERRAEIVRDQLHQLLMGTPRGGKLNFTLTTELPANILELSLESSNVTLGAQHLEELDWQQYGPRQPLIWFWQMFDRTPLALNHWLGRRFRAMLGRHIFRHIGENVCISHGVNFTFGYNLTIEDNVSIRRRAVLDDRGEIILRKGTVLEEFASLYTHTASPESPRQITLKQLEVGPDAWIAPHSVITPLADPGGKIHYSDLQRQARES